jgi:hypothetical protein
MPILEEAPAGRIRRCQRFAGAAMPRCRAGECPVATPGIQQAIREVNDMTIDVRDDERDIVCRALNVYLSDLRHEIVKTENYEMKSDLHRERDVLQNVIARC